MNFKHSNLHKKKIIREKERHDIKIKGSLEKKKGRPNDKGIHSLRKAQGLADVTPALEL